MSVSAGLLWDIFKHVRVWLGNLGRANRERKLQSVRALREVITAARETAVYVRQLEETGRPDHGTERHLAVRWTELGFALQDLGIDKLAKRCQIKGKQWANPKHFDREFLRKADVTLERMERLASEILRQVGR